MSCNLKIPEAKPTDKPVPTVGPGGPALGGGFSVKLPGVAGPAATRGGAESPEASSLAHSQSMPVMAATDASSRPQTAVIVGHDGRLYYGGNQAPAHPAPRLQPLHRGQRGPAGTDYTGWHAPETDAMVARSAVVPKQASLGL